MLKSVLVSVVVVAVSGQAFGQATVVENLYVSNYMPTFFTTSAGYVDISVVVEDGYCASGNRLHSLGPQHWSWCRCRGKSQCSPSHWGGCSCGGTENRVTRQRRGDFIRFLGNPY